MTTSDEFASLLTSAADLGISFRTPVRYVSRNVIANGLRFHVLEWGDPANPPLVLLHGGNQTAHSWDLVSLHLADRYHIVALDQRGHGDSEWPRDAHASALDMASDAAALIEQFGLERPIVVGHSMGGFVTMAFLMHHLAVPRKAVLVDIGPEVSDEGSKVIQGFVRGIGEFTSIDDFVEQVVAYDRLRSKEHIERTARYNLLQRADGKFVTKHDQRRWLLSDTAMASRRWQPTLDDAATFDLPLLVIRGAESNVLPQDLAERFVEHLPQGKLAVVERAAHNVHSQNTPGFLDAFVPFIDA